MEATILSLLQQQSRNFNIYVVYSDDPQLNIVSDKLHFIQFPFSFVSFEDIPDSTEMLHYFSNDKIMMERRWDKSRKIFYGCKAAKEGGCTYLMSVDADDLVSNKLVAHIEDRKEERDIPGFYIDKGYLYKNGEKIMIRIDKGMQNFNGSTHIIHTDFITIPDFEKGVWMDFNLFTSHGWVVHRLKEEKGIDLEPIPFPAVIYVAHGGNISKVNQLNIKDRFKQIIKKIIRGQSVNTNLREEFTIPL